MNKETHDCLTNLNSIPESDFITLAAGIGLANKLLGIVEEVAMMSANELDASIQSLDMLYNALYFDDATDDWTVAVKESVAAMKKLLQTAREFC